MNRFNLRLDVVQLANTLLSGTIRFKAARGDVVIGLDLSDAASTAARCWDLLGESFFFSTLGNESMAPKADAYKGRLFLGRLRRNLRLSQQISGLGYELDIASPNITSMGVWHGGRQPHLAAFVLD